MGCCGNRRYNNNVCEPTKIPRELRPEDIQKLKTNLNNLIDFNDLSYSTTSPVIDEVYHYLNSVQKTDPGVSVFERLLDSSYELIGELPNVWNWLPDEFGANQDAKLLHYTLGTPSFHDFATTPMGDEWHRERIYTDYCLQRNL